MSMADIVERLAVMKKDTAAGGFSRAVVERLESDVRPKRLAPDMWFGPSTIPTMCPRAYTMAYRMGHRELDRHADAKASWNMMLGTAIHEAIGVIAGQAGILYGGWECPECHYVDGKDMFGDVTVDSGVQMPETCAECGHVPGWRADFSYVEPCIMNYTLRVRGFVDGVIRLPARKKELLEVKTCKKSAMANLRKEPYESAVRQLNLCMGLTNIHCGRLVYIWRGAEEPWDGIIEHPVNYNHRKFEEDLERISDFRETAEGSGPIPDCPDGGQNVFGACACSDMEDAWAHYGA